MLAVCLASTACLSMRDTHQNRELVDVLIENQEGIARSGKFRCADCGADFYDSITYSDIKIPIIDINGSLDGISKDTKVEISICYEDGERKFETDATLKWQGASSINYPKKNFTVQFFKNGTNYTKKNKIELVKGWGEESKYCLKANWVDFSHARNVVSGKLYSQVVHSRDLNDEISSLSNAGAVDGYPVLIYHNGEYLGLYTLNIPKDNWMFGMDSKTARQALLMADQWTESVALREHVSDDFSNGWELEYCSTEESAEGTAWVAESFNRMMDFVKGNSGEEFKEGIASYINVDRSIDSLIYLTFICAWDCTAKNILWATYDGEVWFPSVYDMDGAWGTYWDGYFVDTFKTASLEEIASKNELFTKLYECFYDEICQRYKELRQGVLSLSNIDKAFVDFSSGIPSSLFVNEVKKWSDIPNADHNHITQAIEFAKIRMEYLDDYFGVEIPNDSYSVEFNCDSFAVVKAFTSQNYSLKSDLAEVAFARNGQTGYISSDGRGEVNFEIILQDDCTIDDIEIDGEYDALLDGDNVGRSNTYRITNVRSNLTVTIKASMQ